MILYVNTGDTLKIRGIGGEIIENLVIEIDEEDETRKIRIENGVVTGLLVAPTESQKF
jgi:hypothetical protein